MTYGLWMNCIYSNAEQRELVAIAETPEALVLFMARERVESYMQGIWRRSFRAGGRLENYNPLYDPTQSCAENSFGHGIQKFISREESIERAVRIVGQQWDDMVARAERV